MQRVIKMVYTNLCDLKLAIDGTIVMSQNLRDSLDAMYDARIPERWQKVIETSLTCNESFSSYTRYENKSNSISHSSTAITQNANSIHSFLMHCAVFRQRVVLD